ncbi:MAG: hypothetical protein ACRCS9_10975 [Hyphomicrobium sp.]
MREPKGRRARELLHYIRSEVERTGAFPNEAATMAVMGWKCSASLTDALLRLMALGFIKREVIGRHHTRRQYAYRLCDGCNACREGPSP